MADDAGGAVCRTPHDELVQLLDESHDTAAGWHPWNFGHGADAILAAGWRPPLPEQPDGPSPWDAYVAAYREYQETDPHGAAAHPTAHHMHALEAALRVADLPLPDSEIEWQWGTRDCYGRVHSVGVENEGQARAMLSMTPVRRVVGPWIEVPRG